MRATVSACIIAKNEEKYLRDCLDSIHCWVDQIVFVDTGSTDKTLEIAAEFGCRIYHYEWRNDFAAARNFAFSKATKDWTFVIDCDERMCIDDVCEVLAQMAKPELGVLNVQIHNLFEDGDRPGYYSDKVTKLNSPRFFRRSLGLKYQSAVHNYVKLDAHLPGVVWLEDVKIYHLGYANLEEQRAKNKRRLAMIGKYLEAHPTDGRMQFQMAQTMRLEALDSGFEADWRKMVEHCDIGLANPVEAKYGPGVNCQLLEHRAFASFNLKDYEKAIGDVKEALRLKPDYLDAMWLGSQVLIAQGRLKEAREATEAFVAAVRGYRVDRDPDSIIMFSSDGLADALLQLGSIKRELGDLWSGDRDIDSAVKLDPKLQARAAKVMAVTGRSHE